MTPIPPLLDVGADTPPPPPADDPCKDCRDRLAAAETNLLLISAERDQLRDVLDRIRDLMRAPNG